MQLRPHHIVVAQQNQALVEKVLATIPKRRRPSIQAKVGGETEGQTAHKDEKTGHQLFGDNCGDAEATSGKPQVTEPSPPLGFMPIWSSKGGVTIARLTHGLSHPMTSRCMGAAQSAWSSYDKHSQWKSRGTDAAESTESSYDKHSQWKRGSQDDAEAGLNSTKRSRSRLFAYLKQTFTPWGCRPTAS